MANSPAGLQEGRGVCCKRVLSGILEGETKPALVHQNSVDEMRVSNIHETLQQRLPFNYVRQVCLTRATIDLAYSRKAQQLGEHTKGGWPHSWGPQRKRATRDTIAILRNYLYP